MCGCSHCLAAKCLELFIVCQFIILHDGLEMSNQRYGAGYIKRVPFMLVEIFEAVWSSIVLGEQISNIETK